MGSCLSGLFPWERVVNGLSVRLSAWSYVHNLEENLEGLKNAIGALKRKRVYVQSKVDGEEFTNRRQMRFQVREWLEGVQTIETDVDNLIRTSETELERLCLCGVFSEDVVSSCRYGKRVSELLTKVKSLCQEEFGEVTEPTPIAPVDELPIDQGAIVGQETMLDTVWECLMDDKVGIIVGLYGMGGVGKTTLLKQINNKFSKIRGKFDIVIWVVVSQNASVHEIQGRIGKKLNLSGGNWGEKDENQRAVDIFRALKRKRFVLLLDDIWKDWDLSKIGVPSRVTGCKVAFTTRSRDMCGRMGAHHQIEVRCLDSKEAWNLFKHNVGKSTLETHRDIPKLAREVAGECRGLPLALTVIGKAMASKTTIQEWYHAMYFLTSYASEFAGMVEEILPILKYSYDDLKDEHVQSCFLYCSLFPEDSLMEKEKLIQYWIGEGFIDEKEGREKAYNQGYWIIGTLVRASLLEETYYDSESKLKMHDVVRDMALWIASDPPIKDKERYVSKGGLGLNEVPDIKDWRAVQNLSLMKNNIKKISESVECPKLTTLLLQENEALQTISGEFFRCMPKLLVLDLAKANSLTELPEEVLKSVSLRYLDLSHTPIRRLCLEKLKTLIHLDLFSTWALESIEGISNLVSLRTLKLRTSKLLVGESLMKELLLLQHLEYVSIDISSSLVVGGEQSSYDSRIWSSIRELRITERPEEPVKIITLNLQAMKNMSGIWIEKCEMLREIKIETRVGRKSSCCLFFNLRHVVIEGCHGIKDLTWLLLAPNVSYLSVKNSSKIEEIISKEKAAMFLEKGTDTTLPLQNLVRLYLHNLPELKSVYWKPLPTQRLKDRFRSIKECPKLRVKWDDDESKEG